MSGKGTGRIRINQNQIGASQRLPGVIAATPEKRLKDAHERFKSFANLHELDLTAPETVHITLNFPPRTRAFKAGKLYAYLTPPFEYAGWHLAVGHQDRYPTLDEAYYIIGCLVPLEINMVLFMPKTREYLGLEEARGGSTALHFGQIYDDGQLVSQELAE